MIRKSLPNSKWYRDRNAKICELVKQGKNNEALEFSGLSAARINEILKDNGIPDRLTISNECVYDINYF
jgi:hypothetical protein